MELQAKCRSVRMGQTKSVRIWAPYIRGSVDDKHSNLHQAKVNISAKISGDADVDELYSQDNTDFTVFNDILHKEDTDTDVQI